MAASAHTYGQNCRLAPVSGTADSDAFDDTPQINAQFFYTSVLPIDDPLSHGTLAGSSDPKSAKGRLRPFSLGDNNALERAWLSAISRDDNRVHQEARAKRKLSPAVAKANNERLAYVVRKMAAKHFRKHGGDLPTLSESILESGAQSTTPASVCCPELYLDISSELQNAFCALARARQSSLSQDNALQAVMMELRLLQIAAQEASVSDRPDHASRSPDRARAGSSPPASGSMPMVRPGSSHADAAGSFKTRFRSGSTRMPEASTSPRNINPAGGRPAADDGITGTPFARVGSPSSNPDVTADILPQADKLVAPAALSRQAASTLASAKGEADTVPSEEEEAAKYTRDTKEVAVGISRLHMVSIPALQMKPIYWSPVNDIAVVMRATWFYRYAAASVPSFIVYT